MNSLPLLLVLSSSHQTVPRCVNSALTLFSAFAMPILDAASIARSSRSLLPYHQHDNAPLGNKAITFLPALRAACTASTFDKSSTRVINPKNLAPSSAASRSPRHGNWFLLGWPFV